MSTYILTMRDHHYWLVGPFANGEAAAKWNRVEANNPSDDPRWQTIELTNPKGAPKVLSPSEATRQAASNVN